MTETVLAPSAHSQRQPLPVPASDELLLGSRRIRQAFLQTPLCVAGRDAPFIRAGDPEPVGVLIRSGFAYRSCALGDGRRAILDIFVPGDIAGLDNTIAPASSEDVIAAGRVGYHALPAVTLRDMMADHAIALYVAALLAASRWRADRLAASLGRLDAQARICVLFLDMYERLRRRGLISRPTFNLPLTQEQIADHLGLTLVHVNRTLHKLREEEVVLVDRQIVIIQDLDRLRLAGKGLPQAAELPEAADHHLSSA